MMMESPRSPRWLALAIGNSRLHWAAFTEGPSGSQLQHVWHMPHRFLADGQVAADFDFKEFRASSNFWATLPPQPRLYIASVVPQQSQFWTAYPYAQFLNLSQVPLQGLYASFGLDRALTLWGAIAQFTAPVLVIDAGTAITFTGADGQNHLIGGAILPGLRLQFQALGQSTAALPTLSTADLAPLPERWAKDTAGAIASGVIYTLLASLHSFIQDWRHRYPHSPVVITGGDGDRLYAGLRQIDPEIAISHSPNLIFQGIQALKDVGF